MDADVGLAEVFSEFAQTISREFPVQAILDHLVLRIVDLLPVTSAGVTLVPADLSPYVTVASSAAALSYEALHRDVGGGPCELAFSTGSPVAVPDLAADERFPMFAMQARELGLAASFTFPLRHGAACLGALGLYRETPGGLDEATMIVAQALASVTAAYLVNARAGLPRGTQRTASLDESTSDADGVLMYAATSIAGARHRPAVPRGDAERSRSTLHSDLRDGLVNGHLRNEYQPIVRTRDTEVVGVESLLRWDHPVHGLLSPDLTIPLAEESGLIVDLGHWVLERACTDRHDMQAALPDNELQVCVNVSAVELMTPNFSNAVSDTLQRTNTPSRLLTLEVTESVYIDDAERAVVVLEGLKDLGVGIALDDFGTGYSSLIYLQRFPIDTIKLDREFIARLGHNDSSTTIVRTVIDLAHELGTEVVAEGVETADQHERLAELGCDSCQGFLFAKPLTKAKFIHHTWARTSQLSH